MFIKLLLIFPKLLSRPVIWELVILLKVLFIVLIILSFILSASFLIPVKIDVLPVTVLLNPDTKPEFI